MKYTVLSFDERRGHIMLQLHGPHVTHGVFIPLDANDNYLTGEELHRYILETLPSAKLSTFAKVQSGIKNIDEIRALVGTTREFLDDEVYARNLPLFSITDKALPRVKSSDIAYLKEIIEEVLKEKGL